MSAKTNDTIFLAIGGLAIVGAGIWAFVQQSTISELRNAPLAPASGAAYEPSAIKVVTPETRSWAEAPPQKAGEKWVYDVFTPPKIYYNTYTKQFTVVIPEPPKVGEDEKKDDTTITTPAGFGLDLVRVEQPLFRLQLIAHFGEGAQARGSFLNVKTGKAKIGSAGMKIPELNLEIVRFSVERKVVPQAGGTALRYVEVTAVVRDTETGVETKLDPKGRVIDGPPIVTFRASDGSQRTAKSGDVITVGDTTYRVGDLVLEPPSAVVTREAPSLPAPETKTLVVPPPAPPAPVDAPPAPAM